MKNSVKILLLGNADSGKASFINYFLGEDVYASGSYSSDAQGIFTSYKIMDGKYPIEIISPNGIEAVEAQDRRDAIVNEVKRRNNYDDILDWFHTIFYCVSTEDSCFDDLEANFIRKILTAVPQHTYIILAQCNKTKPEDVTKKRFDILKKLGNADKIKILDYTGSGIVPHNSGRYEIAECVLEGLLKDIADKLSGEYANALWHAQGKVLNSMFGELAAIVEKNINLKATFNTIIKDDYDMTKYLEAPLDMLGDGIAEDMEFLYERTDERIEHMLKPAEQLYDSYRCGIPKCYPDIAHLDFRFTSEPDQLDSLEERLNDELRATLLPHAGKYIGPNLEFPEDGSLFQNIRIVCACLCDLIGLKKNILRAMSECVHKMRYDGPISADEFRERAYKRITRCIDSGSPLVHREFIKTDDPLENMVIALSGIQRLLDKQIES